MGNTIVDDNTGSLFQVSIRGMLAPIVPFLDDDTVSEVIVNGHTEVYVERNGRLEKTDVRFPDEESWQAAVRNIAQYVGKRLVPENLSVEARLPDGSRVHIIQSPAARKGTCVAIRKFSKHSLTVQKLIEFGSLTEESAEFLGICVALAKNIIISGGTGSRKTTLLNCLSSMIPEGERILVLEDSSELQLQREHVVPLEAQAPDSHGRGGISIRDLFRGSLRMRPDRIVVGECRGGEAIDMIQAMNSGHSGSMSTAHANSPIDSLTRLEVMCLMGNIDVPLSALRGQICNAVDLVVQATRFHDGVRRVTHISEVLEPDDDGKTRVSDIFSVKPHPDGESKGKFVWTGNTPTFAGQIANSDYSELVNCTSSIWQPISASV